LAFPTTSSDHPGYSGRSYESLPSRRFEDGSAAGFTVAGGAPFVGDEAVDAINAMPCLPARHEVRYELVATWTLR